LYIHGGIYLDIQYTFFSGFKFLELTDKEYYCKDNSGINPDIMICYPKNYILGNCIKQIVSNCKKSFYGNKEVEFIKNQYIHNSMNENLNTLTLPLEMANNMIKKNNKDILYKNIEYKEYYLELWNKVEVYNYPLLKYKKRIDLSKIMNHIQIFNDTYTFYSGSPTIVECPHNQQHYIINIRYINYMFKKTKC
jgi:hypothetical protein